MLLGGRSCRGRSAVQQVGRNGEEERVNHIFSVIPSIQRSYRVLLQVHNLTHTPRFHQYETALSISTKIKLVSEPEKLFSWRNRFQNQNCLGGKAATVLHASNLILCGHILSIPTHAQWKRDTKPPTTDVCVCVCFSGCTHNRLYLCKKNKIRCLRLQVLAWEQIRTLLFRASNISLLLPVPSFLEATCPFHHCSTCPSATTIPHT